MSRFKVQFLPCLPADYNRLRIRLNQMAISGWVLSETALPGFLLYTPTQRTELIYDVIPAPNDRSSEEIQQEVHLREKEGWHPITTFCGMDIYASLPCASPPVHNDPEQCSRNRQVLRSALFHYLTFAVVTAVIFFLMSFAKGISLSALTERWFLSDTSAAVLLLLPLSGAAFIVYLFLMLRGISRCSSPPSNCGFVGMLLRGLVPILCLAPLVLLLLIFWLSRIPRLWIRVVLILLFFILPYLAHFLARKEEKRQTIAVGAAAMILLLSVAVLNVTVSPVSYSSDRDGLGWLTTLSFSRDIEAICEEPPRLAVYDRDESFFTLRESCYISWPDGTYADFTVYTCRFPFLTEYTSQHLFPSRNVEIHGRQIISVTSGTQ